MTSRCAGVGGALAGVLRATSACRQQHPSEVFQVASYAQARRVAAQSGRPSLIAFSTEGCPPCRASETAMQNDSALRTALSDVIFVPSMLDSPADSIALRRQVKGHPTFVAQASLGQELDRWPGFGTSDEWVECFGQALAVDMPVEQFKTQFERDPTVQTAMRRAQLAAASGDFESRGRYRARALQLPGEKPASLVDERLRACVMLDDRDGSRLERNTRDAQAQCAADPACLRDVASVLSGRTSHDRPFALGLARAVRERIAGLDQPELERRRLTLEAHSVHELEHDPVRAAEAWREYLSQTEVPNAGAIVALSAWASDYYQGYDVLIEFGTKALDPASGSHRITRDAWQQSTQQTAEAR